ncbi:hypothetical protein [Mesorhizobium sp. CAU 1732]|uniref:hypothetical protein n=1 Tax=Mesorhizobium sp. CAU 1732 TaxID=3140358 RepID=UPI003261A978
MNGVEIVLVLVIESVVGAASAVAVGRLSHATDLPRTTIAMIGAVGGIVLALLAAQIPGLGHFVGYVGSILDAASYATSGLTLEILFGAGVAGLIGGAVLIGLVSFAYRAMRS